MGNLKFKYYAGLLITVAFIIITEVKIYATVYYVSNTGNDANSGVTNVQAWKTISKINRVFFKPGDQILFKRGDVWNGTINVRYSGKSNNPIIFGAWGDGKNPVISGLTTITDWTNEGNGIYSKSLAVESNPEIVTINEVQYAMGRTPNSDRYKPTFNDYYHIDSYSGTNSFTDNECNAAVNNWKGAEIIVRGSNYIQWGRFPITNHFGNILTFSNPNNYTNGVGFGYFIQNDLKTLDKFGEWYYGGGKFYMYFGLVNPNNFIVKVSVQNVLFDINTQDFITIKNLHLEGANSNAIRTNTASEAYNLTVENCYFDYNTVGINGHIAPEMTISNCTFMRSSRMAVLQTWYSDGTYFGHNTIDSTGLLIGLGLTTGSGVTNFYHGMGVLIDYSKKKYSKKNTIIEHNIVKNSGYSGIVFSGDGSIVRNNYVDSYCLIQSDGGGIYHGGNNDTNIFIGNNIVLNGIINTDAVGIPIGNTHGSQYNIYLDYYSTGGINVTNNTIAHTEGIGLMVHGSQNVKITNNVIYDCDVGIKFQELNGYGSPSRNILMNNNIVVSKNMNDVFVWSRSIINDFNQYGTITNNFYAKQNDDENGFATLVNTWDETYRNFSNWKSYTKLDAGSIFVAIKQKEGEKEKLFYNNTNQTIWFSLGKSSFRYVTGEKITNSFYLEPFSSKILIGKNFDEINQKPQVSDQSFDIKTPRFKNDSIGKISAYDPDNEQVLHYSIHKGNEIMWFFIDSTNGELYVQNDFYVLKELTVELEVVVKDNSANTLSDTARIIIQIEGSDNSPPEITSFSIPSNVNSYYIPIESFSVIDDLGVKGYLLTTSSETPSLNDSAWTSTIPKYFEVSKQGQVILYAWAIDIADNISNPFLATVRVTFPKMSSAFSEYLFEEETGNIILDSKNLADGIIINEVKRGDGALGNGLIFNGNGYVNLGKNYGENIQNQITISLWLKPDSINSDLPIITHGGYYTNTFELYINADSSSILFITNGTSNTAFIVDRIKQLWDGNWHHIAVTYNGSKKSLFFDGIIIAEAEDSGNINSGFWNNMYIGANIGQNDSSFYQGEMDEVRIYNFALNKDEIGILFHPVNKILKTIRTLESVSVCEGENYLGWNKTGIYSRILQRKDTLASEADSIITTNLIVHPNYKTRLEATICEDDTLIFNNQKVFKSGTYSFTLHSVTGCDSIVSLKLSVHPKYLVTEEISILNGTNYLGWTTDGTYQRNLISVNGCDSIVITKLSVVQFFTHTINLEKGWNIFSTYLTPTNSNFRNIVEDIENQNILVAIQDENENTYQNEGSRWINGIGDLEETEGYKMRVKSGSELKINGLPVSLPLNIQLNSGWNIISFPFQGNVNAMEVIQPLINEGILKKVQDERGNSIEYWGNKIGWINGIGNFKTGEGYLMEVSKNGVLTITEKYKKSGLIVNNQSETNHFTRIFEGNGYGHMNINITGLTDLHLEVGDEIATYDGEKCVGTVKLSNLNIANDIVSIQASISDKDIVNGFIEGNKIEILAWRSNTNEEFHPNLEIIGGTPVFQKYGSVFFLLDIVNSSDTNYNVLKNLKIYPNPVSDILNVMFQRIPKKGTLMFLTDITGKKILNREAQSGLEQLNLASCPSGIYLLNIISGKTSVTKRIFKR